MVLSEHLSEKHILQVQIWSHLYATGCLPGFPYLSFTILILELSPERFLSKVSLGNKIISGIHLFLCSPFKLDWKGPYLIK